jgi:hypothetical protein
VPEWLNSEECLKMICTPDTLFLPNTSSYLFLSRLNSVKCVRGRDCNIRQKALAIATARKKKKKLNKINVIDSSSTDRGGRSYRDDDGTHPGECEPMRMEKSKPPTETLVFRFSFLLLNENVLRFSVKFWVFNQRKKRENNAKDSRRKQNLDSIIIKWNRKGSNTTP